MTFFCPFCWAEGPTDLDVCPECGNSLDPWYQISFEDRLIHSLNHPIPAQRMIATRILGMRRHKPAVQAFERLINSESDVYLLREIVSALSLISTDESRRLLERLAHHPSVVVQKACEAVYRTSTEDFLP